ncbi:MAG: nucleoside-diphosphate-sugar epimerase [Acidobacteriaceae bacterium]|nr:nucleoside-diphosphate-sugar epimerase [Acidobacteriaceae bacterium]
MNSEKSVMKIVVIGGSGLIGKKVVQRLRDAGHNAIAASPSSGVDTLTGAGLTEAMEGAQVVIDVANSPSFEDAAVLNFFKTSARNILAAEEAAGVRHHIALSVVGADRLPDSGYMRAKVAQEAAIQAAAVPYTIVRATQFFEFIGAIADGSTVDGAIRLPPALMQPIAAEDIATALADIAVQPPQNGIIEVAGPEPIRMDAIVRQLLTAKHDPRQVVTDPEARYFGAVVNDQSITPGDAPRTTATRFEDWLRQSTPQK